MTLRMPFHKKRLAFGSIPVVGSSWERKNSDVWQRTIQALDKTKGLALIQALKFYWTVEKVTRFSQVGNMFKNRRQVRQSCIVCHYLMAFFVVINADQKNNWWRSDKRNGSWEFAFIASTVSSCFLLSVVCQSQFFHSPLWDLLAKDQLLMLAETSKDWRLLLFIWSLYVLCIYRISDWLYFDWINFSSHTRPITSRTFATYGSGTPLNRA